jgi:putative ABC transport system ATP-binding protein
MNSDAPSKKPCIDLRGIRFSYKPGHITIAIDALRVDPGSRIFLHGPSGSGKSTLLSLIGGILVPQQGELYVLGRDLSRMTASARDTLRGSDIGYIFQGLNLIPYLTVQENIALPCVLHRDRRRRIVSATVDEEVQRLARRLEIQDVLHAPLHELSMGQQQRVAIARAIIGSPPLVIADEPTSSLDHDRRDAFLALLTEMVTETKSTLLFVSHDMSLTRHFDQAISLLAIIQAERRNAQ